MEIFTQVAHLHRKRDTTMSYHRDLSIWLMGVAVGAVLASQLLAGCMYTFNSPSSLAWNPTERVETKPTSLALNPPETSTESTSSAPETTTESSSSVTLPVVTKTTKKREKKTPASSGARELLLPEGHFGLSNQMACLNLAAILAKKYNRTLVVPSNGYAGNTVHDLSNIPFERVYDSQLSAERIPFRIDKSGSQVGSKRQKRQLPAHCQKTIEFDTKHIRNENLGQDPHQHEDCVTLICSWTRLRFVTPPDIFPHVDQVFFPYNDIYRHAAKDVISSIKKQVLEKEKDKKKKTLRLLTLHVRRGDRSTVPLFHCPFLSGLYPLISVDKAERLPVVCSSKKNRKDKDFWEHSLTWDKFFEHMADPDCNKNFPVCPDEFDAIFVATNDPTWVRDIAKESKLPPLFLLGDFPFLKKKLLPETLQLPRPEESVEMLLIEEMIMVLSDRFVPSFESSITQQVLRLRIDAKQEEWDKHLLDTYYDYRARAHKKRWPGEYQ
jgi:hypothetical protein